MEWLRRWQILGESLFGNISTREVFRSWMKTFHPSEILPHRGIRTSVLLALAMMALGGSLSPVRAQDPNSNAPTGEANPETSGRPPQGGPHLLPPHAAEVLNLTEDQKQQLKTLEEEIRDKIRTILTPTQLEQLKQMRPRHRGKWGGAGGQGGPGSGSAGQSASCTNCQSSADPFPQPSPSTGN